MINLGEKLPVGLNKPGLLGPLDLHDDAVLHDRQDGPVTESPQGVSNPGQGGIGVGRAVLRRGGAGGLTVGGLDAHGFLESFAGKGILEWDRHMERGSDHVFWVGEKHADLAGCDGHPFSRLERQIAGGFGG